MPGMKGQLPTIDDIRLAWARLPQRGVAARAHR